MGRGSKTSKAPTQKYHNVTRTVVDGKYVFKATCLTADGLLKQLGTYTRACDAAKAADLASLALRRGKVNFSKVNYTQRMVENERERLKTLGYLAKPKAATRKQRQGRSKQQQMPSQATKEQSGSRIGPDASLPAVCPGFVDRKSDSASATHKRKARALSSPDGAVAADRPRYKRRKVQPAEDNTEPAAATAGLVSTALVTVDQLAAPLQAVVLPTASTVPLGAQDSIASEVLVQQLQSALAAHQASKRQLLAALNALEASEGQLFAVARATGLM